MRKKTANAPKKRPSGGASLKAAGKTGVLVGFTEEEIDVIDRACKMEGRSRANIVGRYSMAAIRQMIEKQRGQQ